MSKDKISDYSTTANSNTDIGGINVDEGCAPSGINDAIRTLMAQLKTWQSGGQDVYIHPAGSASAPSITANGDTNTGIFFPAADTVGITTGGTERARVDSSGNLGLGVTPSSWGSVSRAMQFQNGVSIFSNTSGLGGLGNNVYSNPGTADYYIANGYATRYYQFNGTHVWNTAASGSAGGTISFTQAMTLDASGNLGVGTTSPLTRLHAMSSASSVAFALSPNSSNTNIGYLINDATYISFGSSVGSTGVKFRVALAAPDNAATIDSSGNLLVGTTSTSDVSAGAVTTQSIGTTNTYIKVGHKTGSITGSDFVAFYYNTSQIGGCAQNGTTAVSFNTTSDYRLKTNVVPLTGALAKVEALKPSSFEWIDGRQDEGFIAHELQAVLPNVVSGAKDAVQEDGSPKYQQVDYSKIVTVLTAAIQELKAEFDAYKASHP